MSRLARREGLAAALISLLALWVFLGSNSAPTNFYNHFAWQADAFLAGRTEIAYPAPAGYHGSVFGNDYFQDVQPVTGLDGAPSGLAQMPFPPLPALVLAPFVAAFGLAVDQTRLAMGLAGIQVGLLFLLSGYLGLRLGWRLVLTAFGGFGTALWYSAAIGSTWFFAHLVALLPMTLAVMGALAWARRDLVPPAGRSWRARLGRRLSWPMVGLGLLLGLAATARLPIAFGGLFLVVIGPGGTWRRRGLSAALGLGLPVGGLLLYNLAATGHLFHPAYEYLYQMEVKGYPALGYNGAWGIEDLHYLVKNLPLMLFGGPDLPAAGCPPDQVRALFARDCPIALPKQVGMGLLLTSPAYLAALTLLRPRRGRLHVPRAAWAALAGLLPIAALNLAHFSQGWVQFGYRFANDFLPFAFILTGLGLARLVREGPAGRLLALGLVAISLGVTWWGVSWGVALGW